MKKPTGDILSKNISLDKFNLNFGPDLLIKCTCNCCELNDSEYILVIGGMSAIVTHVCEECYILMEPYDDYCLFKKHEV
jgi:hypothetical protein